MTKITIDIRADNYARFLMFKRVWDTLFPEEPPLEQYFQSMIEAGFEAMLKEALPPDMDTMHVIMQELFRREPEMLSEFFHETFTKVNLKEGELEKKARKILEDEDVLNYIG